MCRCRICLAVQVLFVIMWVRAIIAAGIDGPAAVLRLVALTALLVGGDRLIWGHWIWESRV
jgi:hypothetical protein